MDCHEPDPYSLRNHFSDEQRVTEGSRETPGKADTEGRSSVFTRSPRSRDLFRRVNKWEYLCAITWLAK